MLMYDNNALMWSVIIRIKTNYYTDILHCFVYYDVLYLYRIDVNKGNLLWRENKTTMISLSTSNTENVNLFRSTFHLSTLTSTNCLLYLTSLIVHISQGNYVNSVMMAC